MQKRVTGIVLDGYFTKCLYADGTTSGGMQHKSMFAAERYAESIAERLALPLHRITENYQLPRPPL